jgi:hypothetical protein
MMDPMNQFDGALHGYAMTEGMLLLLSCWDRGLDCIRDMSGVSTSLYLGQVVIVYAAVSSLAGAGSAAGSFTVSF